MTYYEVVNNNHQTCGHKHKTEEAAEKCQEKLQETTCQFCGKTYYGSWGTHCKCWSPVTSAKWYNSTVRIVEE